LQGRVVKFVATNNVISDNDSSGILMYSSELLENIFATIENNTISNNQNLGSNASGGIDLEQFSNICVDLNNNILLNNISSGLFISSTEPSPTACLEMSGNSSNTGYVFSSTGDFSLAPTQAALLNSGEISEIGIVEAVNSCSCSH
jgi:hypothetical protein